MDGDWDSLPRVDAVFHKMSDLIFDARQGKKTAVDKLEKFVVSFAVKFLSRVAYKLIEDLKVSGTKVCLYDRSF